MFKSVILLKCNHLEIVPKTQGLINQLTCSTKQNSCACFLRSVKMENFDFFSLKLISKETLFASKFDSHLVNTDWLITWQVKQTLDYKCKLGGGWRLVKSMYKALLFSLSSQRGKEVKKMIMPDLRLCNILWHFWQHMKRWQSQAYDWEKVGR